VDIVRTSPRNENAEFQWWWVSNETHKMIARDWVIPDFQRLVETENPRLLRLLWTAIVTAPEDRADAVYQANGSKSLYRMRSQLLQTLTSVPWIPDKYGNRCLPEDMTPYDLDENLELPAQHPPLLRAGFGREAAANVRERAEANEAAKRFGFDSSDELESLARLRQRDPARFADLVALAEQWPDRTPFLRTRPWRRIVAPHGPPLQQRRHRCDVTRRDRGRCTSRSRAT
jgi:hypothetical protein